MAGLLRRVGLAELRAFCVAVELGSLGRAARLLRVTQPALSKRMRELELLAALLRYAGRIHTREQLLELVWGTDSISPKAVDGQVAIRPMMYIALTYDHRIIDGREAVQFLVTVKQCLEDPARMVLGI